MTVESKLKSNFTTVDGHKVHYQTVGEGPALMLIHGGGPGAYGYSNYSRNIGPLSEKFQVIVIDLPGYGQSEFMPAPDSAFAPLSRAVMGVLDDMGIKKANLVGNSLGGGTSLRTALDYPERIDKLILMGPAGSVPIHSPFPTEGLIRMLTFYQGEAPSLEKIRRVVDLLVFDPSAITDELLEERLKVATKPEIMANPPLRGRGANPKDDLWREPLNTLTHPTLIIWGREDRVVPIDAAYLLLKTIPNASLHVFPKCGHWAQWEKADEFNELVANFVTRPTTT